MHACSYVLQLFFLKNTRFTSGWYIEVTVVRMVKIVKINRGTSHTFLETSRHRQHDATKQMPRSFVFNEIYRIFVFYTTSMRYSELQGLHSSHRLLLSGVLFLELRDQVPHLLVCWVRRRCFTTFGRPWHCIFERSQCSCDGDNIVARHNFRNLRSVRLLHVCLHGH